jgi:hypothetical protein
MTKDNRDKSKFPDSAFVNGVYLGPYEVTQGMAGWFVIQKGS